MTIYSDDSAWNPLAVDAEVEEILGKYGILDERLKQKVTREARIRLTERATKDVTRLMATRALSAGWRPPPTALEPRSDDPMPPPASVQDRVLRWASLRPDFSARDLQRAVDWFDCAADVRCCLNGLVARGELEVLAARRRPGGGRLPSARYRVVKPPSAGATQHADSWR